MKHVSGRLLAWHLAIAFLGLAPVTSHATSEDDVERAEAERRAAYDRLVAVNADLESALLQYNEINAELEVLEARIEVITGRIATAEVEMAEMVQRAEELVRTAYMA
ncbi:MAG: hypothetical protein H0V96_11745, partial [Acidimicrobiia bacterium]|nr:hypothetical protein [Acidimicrobiia bacterium]